MSKELIQCFGEMRELDLALFLDRELILSLVLVRRRLILRLVLVRRRLILSIVLVERINSLLW